MRATLLVLTLAALNAAAQSDTLTLRITHGNACDTVLSMIQLQQLPSRTVQVAGHDGEAAMYTGALLMDVLSTGCPSVGGMSKRARVEAAVRVDARDDYHAIVAMMEADTSFRSNPVLLTWARDGAALDAHNGPLQLIVPDDRRHARNVRQVNRLSVIAP